jgi:hypothetical protein
MDEATPLSHAVAAPSAELDDVYCHACGRLLNDPAAAWAGRQPHERRWWPWVLVAVGVFLVVSFGLQAWQVPRALDDRERALLHASGCPSDKVGEQDCPQNIANWRGRAVEVQAARDIARRQMSRAMAVALAGQLMVLVGLGIPARGQVRRGPRGWLPASLLGLWALGEGLCLALFCMLLGGYGYVLVGRLAVGGTLTWALVDQAADQVLAVILDLARVG